MVSESTEVQASTGTVPSGTTAGVITLTPDHTDWTNQDVKVTATTNQTGYTLQVSTDGTNYSDGNIATLQANGKAYARLRDASNNYGEPTSIEVKIIDKGMPTNTAPAMSTTTDTITATLKQTDALSGVDTTKTKYRLVTDSTGTTAVSGRDWQTSNKFTGLKTGTYFVQTQVTDKAGNTTTSAVTTAKTGTVPSGTTSGVITLTPDHNTWTNTDVVVTAKTNQTGYTIQMSTDGKTFKDGNKVTLTQNGTVYARLRDASNNYGGTASKAISIIDKIAPTNIAPTATATSSSITVTNKQTDVNSRIKNSTISNKENFRFYMEFTNKYCNIRKFIIRY